MNARELFIVLTRVLSLWVLVLGADELRYIILLKTNLYQSTTPFILFVSHFILYAAIGFFLLLKTELLANWIYNVQLSVPESDQMAIDPEVNEERSTNQP